MKRLACITVSLGLLCLASAGSPAERQPEQITLSLAWVADAGEPHQYVFVINGIVAYRTYEGLKQYLQQLPRGSTLTWNPGCSRLGDEPLLNSNEEMQKFKDFCETHGITLVLIPSG